MTARLAGLPVLAAEANAALSDPLRRLGTLAVGLLAVLLVLLLVTAGAAGARVGARVGAGGADRARDRLVGARAVAAAACR